MGVMHAPVVTAIGKYFDKKQPIVMGVATCGSGVGVFGMVQLAEYFHSTLNWKNSHFGFGENSTLCNSIAWLFHFQHL